MNISNKSTQFALEEIHCESPISETDLDVIISTCPRLSRVKIVYRPDESQGDNQELPHLNKLSLLQNLTELSIISADFYNHSLFSSLPDLGQSLTSLELVDCDEMNVNALIMIGDTCPKLSSLTISCCHFNLDMEQRNKINELCSLQVREIH